MQRRTKLIIAGLSLAALIFALILPQISIAVPAASAVPAVPTRFDNGSLVNVPFYERSMRPQYSAGTIPFRDLATMSPTQALSFYQQTADATPSYHPQFQRFIARNDASIGFSMPSYPASLVPGGPEGWVRVGFVYNKSDESLRLPLFGRPVIPGGNRFDYYVLDDSRHANPIGLNAHNGLELENDNVVSIPGYHHRFFVHIY